MPNSVNQGAYSLWASFYDLVFGRISIRPRTEAIGLLSLQAGERLFIPGIGTGLDLLLLPDGISVFGLDFSAAMLAQAQLKIGDRPIELLHSDAQQLPFADAAFDAVLFNLALSVVPDGAAAFREGWRVLRPGGRAAIFDKFLPESSQLTPVRQLIGAAIRAFGTDPNRKLSAIIGDTPGVQWVTNQPSLLGGQYRVVFLQKSLL